MSSYHFLLVIAMFLVHGNYCSMFSTKICNIHLGNCHKEEIVFILEKCCYSFLACEIGYVLVKMASSLNRKIFNLNLYL
jgi:hypothetical protein